MNLRLNHLMHLGMQTGYYSGGKLGLLFIGLKPHVLGFSITIQTNNYQEKAHNGCMFKFQSLILRCWRKCPDPKIRNFNFYWLHWLNHNRSNSLGRQKHIWEASLHLDFSWILKKFQKSYIHGITHPIGGRYSFPLQTGSLFRNPLWRYLDSKRRIESSKQMILSCVTIVPK